LKDGSAGLTPKKQSSQWKYPPCTHYEKNANCAGEGNQYQMHHSITRDYYLSTDDVVSALQRS